MSTPVEKLLSVALKTLDVVEQVVSVTDPAAAVRAVKTVIKIFRDAETGKVDAKFVHQAFEKYEKGRRDNTANADRLLDEEFPKK